MRDQVIRDVLQEHLPRANVLFARKDGMRHVIAVTGDLQAAIAKARQDGYEIEPGEMEKAS